MKLKKLMEARKTIMQLADKQISVSLAYKFMKFIKSSDDEDDFYNKRFQEIINKYGERDEQGKLSVTDSGIKIQPDKIDQCKDELVNLGNTDINPPEIKFSIEELSELKLSMMEVSTLDDFIN